jgi:imidazolonepropionase-like amidohydrolase
LKTVLIAGGNVIDGTGSAPQSNTDVLIKGDRIVGVGKNLAIDPADISSSEKIDATGLTVMPGLIDAHVHVTLGEPRTNDELFMHRDAPTSAILAAYNVRKILKAGVTSMLDVDGIFNIGPALRDSINSGIVEGPTMRSGSYALMTAVGGTAGKLIPDSGTAGYAEVVRNKEEMVLAVRRQVKEGADIISIDTAIAVHIGGAGFPRGEEATHIISINAAIAVVVSDAHTQRCDLRTNRAARVGDLARVAGRIDRREATQREAAGGRTFHTTRSIRQRDAIDAPPEGEG